MSCYTFCRHANGVWAVNYVQIIPESISEAGIQKQAGIMSMTWMQIVAYRTSVTFLLCKSWKHILGCVHYDANCVPWRSWWRTASCLGVRKSKAPVNLQTPSRLHVSGLTFIVSGGVTFPLNRLEGMRRVDHKTLGVTDVANGVGQNLKNPQNLLISDPKSLCVAAGRVDWIEGDHMVYRA